MSKPVSDKLIRLRDLLYEFPQENIDIIPNERTNAVVVACLAADANGWVDEFIRICEDNKGKSFEEIKKLIFTEERFPPLEIVDDDEE